MALDHLAVYLSNSCNLGCRYCYVAVNQGPAARLGFEDVRRAIDEFFANVPPPDRKITFLGGEPLLDWRLFERCARYAREAGGADAVLQVFTNGTTLTPEKAAIMEELGIHCTISLDGRREDNDRNRAFFRAPERSVFDATLARIRALPDRSRLGVSLVFTSETVDRLLPNIDFFRGLGFGRITFNPELYEVWPQHKLDVLRAALSGLSRYYKLLLERGEAFQIQILYAVLEAERANRAGLRWWHECHNMVLGPDGHYYACDKALSFPVGEAASGRSGTAAAGLDWGERGRQLGAAAAEVEAAGYGDDEHFCPIGVREYARHKGVEAGSLLENFHRVARTFSDGLLELVAHCRAEPQFNRLYRDARIV